MSEVTITDLVNMIPKAFIPEKAEGVDSTIVLNITGEGGGQSVVRIANKVCNVEQGTTDLYDFLLEASAADALDLFHGKLDPVRAYMQGKVHLKGNLMKAMKLINLFNVPR